LLCHFVPEPFEARSELRVPCAARARTRAHDDVESGQLPLAQPEALADEPANSIALDGAASDLRRDGKPEPWACRGVRARDDAEEAIAEPPTLGVRRIEVALTAQAPPRGKPEALEADATPRHALRRRYGMSFLRPFARRRARTLRPFAVAIRARNPCVRLRRTLLG